MHALGTFMNHFGLLSTELNTVFQLFTRQSKHQKRNIARQSAHQKKKIHAPVRAPPCAPVRAPVFMGYPPRLKRGSLASIYIYMDRHTYNSTLTIQLYNIVDIGTYKANDLLPSCTREWHTWFVLLLPR